MIFAVDFARNRNIACLGLLRGAGNQHDVRDRFQRLALFGSRFLVDVIVGESPIAEGTHHRFAGWALRHVRDRETVELGFAVSPFFNKEHLPAAAGHLRWFGIEPAWARGVTRTGLLQLPGDLPRCFV